jgi:hypothetical protein
MGESMKVNYYRNDQKDQEKKDIVYDIKKKSRDMTLALQIIRTLPIQV